MAFKSLLEEGMDPEIKMEEQESASPEPGEEREGAVLPKSERSSEQAEKKVKEEPVEGPSGNWDAQLQEFLRTLQAPCSGEENSQLSEQSPKLSQDTTDAHKWPRGLWASQTLPYLPGAAQPELKVHLAVPPGEKGRERSVVVGAAGVEMQRQRFRMFCYQESGGPRELCRQLQALCHQWLKPERNTKEQMLELVTLEQFVAALPLDMQNWLRENGPETCAQAVNLAEGFLLRQQEAKGWGQQTTGVTEAEHTKPTSTNQALPDVKMPLSSGSEQEQEGSTSLLAGDRWLSENEEQKPFAESPEKMEQLQVLLKTDRGKAILRPREADENRHSQSSHVVTHEKSSKCWHFADFKEEKSYKCWHCGQSFNNITDLLTHERTHLAGDLWLSENEGQKPFAESPEKMEQPRVLQKTDRGKAILHQGEADENRHSQSSHVVMHESIVIEEKLYKCWHCGQSFSSSTDLLTHERTHVGEKMYKCPHCGERERMRMGQKLNKCSRCGNTLGWNPRGRIHVVQKPYTSSECRKEYIQISDFLNHQRIHEQKTAYTCSKCGENFGTYTGLKAHRRTHTSESQYKCSHCGMCFNWSSHLRLHERIHTEVCSYCGKSFSQKSELVEHEKTHAAEGSFVCFTCGKTFAVSSELAAHVRTYAEKPLKCSVSGKLFQCSECGDSFNHNSALTVHQKIHTGKKS